MGCFVHFCFSVVYVALGAVVFVILLFSAVAIYDDYGGVYGIHVCFDCLFLMVLGFVLISVV